LQSCRCWLDANLIRSHCQYSDVGTRNHANRPSFSLLRMWLCQEDERLTR
jgi:hypothetical protein